MSDKESPKKDEHPRDYRMSYIGVLSSYEDSLETQAGLSSTLILVHSIIKGLVINMTLHKEEDEIDRATILDNLTRADASLQLNASALLILQREAKKLLVAELPKVIFQA